MITPAARSSGVQDVRGAQGRGDPEDDQAGVDADQRRRRAAAERAAGEHGQDREAVARAHEDAVDRRLALVLERRADRQPERVAGRLAQRVVGSPARRSSSTSPLIEQMGYAASKGVLLSSMYYLAKELGPSRIRVNTVVPSWMWGPPVQTYVAPRPAASPRRRSWPRSRAAFRSARWPRTRTSPALAAEGAGRPRPGVQGLREARRRDQSSESDAP